ncbi:MAG: exo-alpha-sialidase [Acidobacteria bacterium]|nr:exo-alpha-sialidase [Acidobacteriota bacterium]
MLSRRHWLASGGALLAQRRLAAAPLFEGFAIEPRTGVQEAILNRLADGRLWLLFGEGKKLVGKFSADGGRTWGPVQPLLEKGGSPIVTGRDNVHLSLLHLPSGKLGIVYGGPYSRPGRDGTLHFRSSADGGASWSPPVVIDPVFSLCRTAGARVLSNGRIAVPTFNWYSSAAGGESESASNSICVSWVFYSDDEGVTWHRSLSEMFVSLDAGRGGCYSFEERSLEERADGSLLMFGRTERGTLYQCVSTDKGVRWSAPKPVPLAASYAPPLLVRIPASADILLLWNQASAGEIRAGLSRHRLSSAVSKDGGATWNHFRNLESMDDRTRLEPPDRREVLRSEGGYRQPQDRARYPHSPANLRICYPTVTFSGNEVAIAYDYGYGPGEFEKRSATRIKIVTKAWLYGA